MPWRLHLPRRRRSGGLYLSPRASGQSLGEGAAVKAWLQQHGSEDQGEDKEQEVILRLLSSFDELQLSGGILRVGGQIVAFTIGSPINETTFGVHIEKANRDYDGAFTVINKLFASTIPERYTYVNREEDLGIEGLRKAKLSYKPDIILQKIAAVLRHECPTEP